MAARRWVVVMVVPFSAVLGSCSGGSDATLPEACTSVPVRMQVERSGEIDAGGAEVTITDALALSVPFLSGEEARKPEDVDLAATTPRMFWLYLADVEIPRAAATSANGVVTAEQLLGKVQLQPAAGETLRAGQVLEPISGAPDDPSGVGSFGVEYRDGDPTATEADASTGSATILHLDADTLCVELDLHLTLEGQPTVDIVGTVAFPIVEAGWVVACPPPPSGGCTRAERTP